MQDRFKFRVWEKDQKIMKECTQITLDKDQTGSMCDVKGKVTAHLVYQPHYILMQCTGKKDKHNKLIYEGDIVRLTGKNKVTFEYLVKYRLSEYRYVLEYANGKFKGRKARDFSKEYAQVKNLYDGGYEVIGNIYENPELLEG